MKKKNVALLLFFIVSSVIIYAYTGGAATHGVDGTGVSGSGCGGCHGSASSFTISIELDSAGVAVTQYHPGASYTVKISGTNTSSSSLPRFGFQMSVIHAANNTDAGTWGTTLPTGVRKTTTTTSGLTQTVIEQNTQIVATSGTGGNGTTYVVSVPWTAPVAGTGSVKLYGVINAVNYNNNDGSTDKAKVATPVTITEAVTPTSSVAIALTSGTNPTCSGSSLTFTATPTGGGASPTYQWKVNGNNVGTGGTTYTSNTLTTGQIVTCVMTPSGGSAVTSNSITVTVNPTVTPTISIAASQNNICSGTSVTFTATATNGGTTPVYLWKLNGNTVGSNSTTYTNAALVNGDVITCQLTSNATCASPTIVTSSNVTMTVNTLSAASVSISSGGITSICAGTNVTFTAIPVNGGSNPAYQWKKNGANISGATASTYSSTALANGDVITVAMTSNSACASPTTATSNSITITVAASVTPSVSIVSGSGTSICAGTNVTFTATPVNGGNTPAYQWKKNGADITGATSATYSSSSLVTGDVITVVLTSNATCATTTTATSNTITITVNSSVTPSVSIASNLGTSICNAQSVTFTATPVNGGSAPTYQWKKNGANISGATSATYTSTSIANGDVITVVLTSNAACATTTTATSNSLTMSIVSNGIPSVTITATPGNTICSGQSATFTATPVNGGSAPTYQWTKNGINISGANSSTYTTSNLTTGDVIALNMVSNSACVSQTGATSNSITISIGTSVTALVSISSNLGTNFCIGQSITFTATAVNGGNTPVYQWKDNGVNITGATASTYTSSSIANGAVISVDMTSSIACVAQPTVSSNAVTMHGDVPVTPSVNIAADNGMDICTGQTITFTAQTVNGGSSPVYQWNKNGANVGASATYTDNTLATGDVINCILTSNAICATPNTSTSNSLTIANVYALPTVDVTMNNDILHSTQAVSYQWIYNGVDIDGETGQSYAPDINGDYEVRITDAHGCQNTSSPYTVTFMATGINGVTSSESISIYPNPTRGNLHVNLSSVKDETVTVNLFNVAGRSFYQQQLAVTNGQFMLNVGALDKGVYVLEISHQKETLYKRVVVGW